MPLFEQGELRELLSRELPGALAPPTRAVQRGNGHVTAQQERQTQEAETSADTSGRSGSEVLNSSAPAEGDTAPLAAPEPDEHEGEVAGPRLNDADAVVVAERLPDVLRLLRGRGYEYLSHITAVDYPHYGIIEVIYHLYNAGEGGAGQMVRVRVAREQAVIPSISTWWPGANLQEREAWDLYGVQFPGHPFHHRIYMWEEFEGHPMRKDFDKIGDTYYHFKWKGEDGDEE